MPGRARDPAHRHDQLITILHRQCRGQRNIDRLLKISRRFRQQRLNLGYVAAAEHEPPIPESPDVVVLVGAEVSCVYALAAQCASKPLRVAAGYPEDKCLAEIGACRHRLTYLDAGHIAERRGNIVVITAEALKPCR